MDQKVSFFNMIKKDPFLAIALMKRNIMLKVLLNMAAMATSYSLWRFHFTGGFHMSSLKFKLQIFLSFGKFTFMTRKSS